MGAGRPSVLATVTVAGLVLGSCASGVATAGSEPEPERPAACSDPVYVELRAQHPDSLSERAWERLQKLEDDCERERRARPLPEATTGHHGGWRGWAPLMMVLGTAMMVMMVLGIP